MPQTKKSASLQDRLLPLINLIITGRLGVYLSNTLEAWNLIETLRERFNYHGMYEILEYDATLELLDSRGETAVFSRHETIRFLQDNVVAIHDHAWGDGDLFYEYHCQPGIPVDFYEDGSRYNILISLRETKNRGDVIELWVERVVKCGFLEDQEWLETIVDHRMRRLKLAVIFPKKRRCQRATLTRRSTGKTVTLGSKHLSLLADGRQRLSWSTHRPRLHDLYTVKWLW